MRAATLVTPPARARQLLVVTVGHVDHGKSTLIGRLLHDTNNLPDGKVAEMRAASERRGVAFEWSFVLDALQSERDQAITIDTTRIWLRLPEREVVMIDAPGHTEFLRNMVTGASDADAALLVVDGLDGVSEQTRRHALLLELIGVRQVIVVVNKMDRVGYDERRFEQIRGELRALLGRIGIAPGAFVPVAARDGDNVVAPSRSMRWYAGPTVAHALQTLSPVRRNDGRELRIAVQGVIRRDLDRVVVGRIEAGTLRVGAEVVLSPGRRRGRVKTLENWPVDGSREAVAGESAGFTLDRPLFIERGDIVSDAGAAPPDVTRFRARMLWLADEPLRQGDLLQMRAGTKLALVVVDKLERVVDIAALEDRRATTALRNDVVEVILRSRQPLALDTVAQHPALGRFILIRELDVVGGGTILETFAGEPARDVVVAQQLTERAARAERNGHAGAVFWLTGLPAAGKSTLAMRLERRLFECGVRAYVLDGDTLRTGLCRDLGFSQADRRENIRRAGETAALFADAGIVTIAALISPASAGRERARLAAGDNFYEVYVKADESVREARDPKGHYAKTRAGEILDFSGIDGTYEVPENPDLLVDTARLSIEEAVEVLFAYVCERIGFQRT